MKKKIYRVFICMVLIACLLTGTQQFRVSAAVVGLNKSKATLYLDKKLTLKLQNSTGKVTWSSSNTKIAKVNDKGVVTPKKKGTVVITAKNNGIKYTCKVTVKKPKLNFSTNTITAGESFKLKLTGATIDTVTTGDEYVATVEQDGAVTGTYPGTTDITVTSTAGRKLVCKLTVEAREAEDHKHISTEKAAVAPTCTEKGYTYGRYCAICNEILVPQREIEATGHNFVNNYCTICGAPSDDVHFHKFVTQEAVEPTCTTSGLTEGLYCETCGEVFKRQTSIPALGHKMQNGTCTVCGKHIHEAVIVKEVPMTCFVDGTTEWSFCKWCGETLKEPQVIKSPGCHEYGEDGHCIRCTADKNGHIHTWKIEPAVKQGCETVGLTEGKYCTTCQYREKFQSFIPPTGHIYQNGKCKFCGKAEPK